MGKKVIRSSNPKSSPNLNENEPKEENFKSEDASIPRTQDESRTFEGYANSLTAQTNPLPQSIPLRIPQSSSNTQNFGLSPKSRSPNYSPRDGLTDAFPRSNSINPPPPLLFSSPQSLDGASNINSNPAPLNQIFSQNLGPTASSPLLLPIPPVPLIQNSIPNSYSNIITPNQNFGPFTSNPPPLPASLIQAKIAENPEPFPNPQSSSTVPLPASLMNQEKYQGSYPQNKCPTVEAIPPDNTRYANPTRPNNEPDFPLISEYAQSLNNNMVLEPQVPIEINNENHRHASDFSNISKIDHTDTQSLAFTDDCFPNDPNSVNFNDELRNSMTMDPRLSTIMIKNSAQIAFNKINAYENLKNYLYKKDFEEYNVKSCYESVDIQERVDTISKSWILIDRMKEMAPFNANFVKNIDEVLSKKKIIGWKKSRGDGNCYYRAVITRYMEILHKFYNPSSYLLNFIKILNRVQNSDFFTEGNQAKAQILKEINENLARKQNSPIDNFKHILERLQDKEFDRNLVLIARLITLDTLHKAYKDPEYMNFIDDIEYYTQKIVTMGEEAEGIILLFLPLGLDCQVIQLNFFDNIIEQKYPEEDKTITIHIIRRPGHYDILYTLQEMEIEQYNFKTGNYNFLRDIQRL